MTAAAAPLSFETIGNDYICQLDDDNRIRIERDPDPMPPTDWTDTPGEIEMQLYNDGDVFGIIREKKCPACNAWTFVDSVWSVYGLQYAEEYAKEFI